MTNEPEQQEEVVGTPSPLFADDTGEQNPRISTVPVVPQLSVALGLLVLVFGVTYLGASRSLSEQSKEKESAVYVDTELQTQGREAFSLSRTFADITLQAESAIVWDVKNQRILFNKNADDIRPLASITKLMTALVAYELLDPEEKVAITLDALRVSGDSGFTDGEEFTVQNLTDLVLIASSNDGAAALANDAGARIAESDDPEAVFVRAMNLRAKELGLTKTTFSNSTGLDLSPTEAGAYGSARDVARLMDYIIVNAPDTVALTNLEVTTVENEEGAYHLAKNTNEATGSLEGLIASKTGYTALSGGNLVVAVNAGLNRPIVVAVLGSSYEGRFSDVEKLVLLARQYVGKGE